MIHSKTAPEFRRNELKEYVELEIYHPKLCFLSYYIQNHYRNDIYLAFRKNMNLIKTFMSEFSIYYHHNLAILISLDDVFLQTQDFSLYTNIIWKDDPKIYQLYQRLNQSNISPILPYMYILYSYAVSRNIRVIFMTRRSHRYSQNIRLNLSRLGVLKYNIITSIKEKHKQKMYFELTREYNIITTLDDQNTLKNVPGFVKFPNLYTN